MTGFENYSTLVRFKKFLYSSLEDSFYHNNLIIPNVKPNISTKFTVKHIIFKILTWTKQKNLTCQFEIQKMYSYNTNNYYIQLI